MKKLFALMLAVILLVSLCSCGNKSYGWGNYNFTYVHITTKNNDKCCKINKWYESDTGIEVELENGDHLWLSEGTYILVEDTCPICGGD